MRLPWLFRRSPAAPRSAAASPVESSASRSAPAPAPGGAPSGPRREWRALPALVETIGEPPLIAPPRPFKQALAVNRAPTPALAPLGHRRSLAAPSGLVLGVARPLPAAAGGQAALSLSRPATIAQAWPADAQPAGVDADSNLSPEGHDMPVATSPSPARRLPATDGPLTAPHRALARLEPADLALLPSAPPAGTLRQAPRGTQRSARTAGASRVASPEPVQPTPDGRQAEPFSSGVSRLTLGQSRRLGLGAPLPALPASAVQRAPQAGESGWPTNLPLATHQASRPALAAEIPAAPLAPADAAPAATPPSEAAGRTSALLAPAPAPLAPAGLPVLRLATPPPLVAPGKSPRPPDGSQRGGAAATTASRARAGRSVAPLLASRPLRSRVQRAPSTAAGNRPSAGATLGDGPVDGPVRVHRGGEASQAAAAFQARAFTHGGEVFLPARHGPLNSGTARSLLAHELVHVAQQRSLGGELPTEDSPRGRALEAQARAAELGGETPLVLAAPTHGARVTETAAEDRVMRSPQRDAINGQPQDEPQPTGRTETAVVQLSTIQRAAEAPSSVAPNPSAAVTTRSEQELEELARQLYGRIHLRLRRELMVDRERAGLVFDGR